MKTKNFREYLEKRLSQIQIDEIQQEVLKEIKELQELKTKLVTEEKQTKVLLVSSFRLALGLSAVAKQIILVT